MLLLFVQMNVGILPEGMKVSADYGYSSSKNLKSPASHVACLHRSLAALPFFLLAGLFRNLFNVQMPSLNVDIKCQK